MIASQFYKVFGHDADFWGEHPEYALSDWRREVTENETRLGYWDWVKCRVEEAQSLSA